MVAGTALPIVFLPHKHFFSFFAETIFFSFSPVTEEHVLHFVLFLNGVTALQPTPIEAVLAHCTALVRHRCRITHRRVFRICSMCVLCRRTSEAVQAQPAYRQFHKMRCTGCLVWGPRGTYFRGRYCFIWYFLLGP